MLFSLGKMKSTFGQKQKKWAWLLRLHVVTFDPPTLPAESHSGKGKYLKRIRYHGRGMFGIMDKVYCHYFVKLVEGPPPAVEPRTGLDQAQEYLLGLRSRTVRHSL